ncbi:MAG: NUDIX hydrolase [Deltaproteobacteria bacterium]|nr:NUDIX hydrolase [Deltaproteobacteria bacterium]
MTARNPFPTVDVIVETPQGVVLVRRRNPPPGWALPGGFVERGERVEDAAVREVREETGLDVELTLLFGVYSDPSRDPRFHTMSVVYVGRASGTPQGGDDASEARAFPPHDLPGPIAFDHASILDDYRRWRETGALPRPAPTRPDPA